VWDDQIQELEQAGSLVNFPSPERAAMALVNLWHMAKLQRI
jgi:hypothetical protein